MIKLTEVLVKRPVAAIMIISAIIIFGAMALISMPQELTPDIEMPMIIIYTVYPGAGPEDVEKLVSTVVEEALGSVSGVKRITSRSMENASVVMVQCDFGINTRTLNSDIKERVDRISNRLPDECRKPTVMEMNINAMPTMTMSLTSESIENLLRHVEDEIIPQFNRLSSVASISVSGGREDYICVEVKEDMLREYNITISALVSATSNADYTAPLGAAVFGDADLAVRTQVRYDDLDGLRNMPITLKTGDVIRLSDVADIYIATEDAQSISRYNGNANINLSIQKRQSASANRVSREVRRTIDSLAASDPEVSIRVINDNSERISSAVNSIAQTMILSIVMSMLVLFIFFGDLRVSLIVGSSMPVSILVTFVLMNFMGHTLNIVSMSGLILGVGMMVDNAIVVIDSCFKSSVEERSFVKAAVDGTKFVLLSIFAGTLTTIVVFLPLATVGGMSGQLFAPLGFAIVFSLTASLLSAITLVPLFFVQFKPLEQQKALGASFLKKMEQRYANLLGKMLPKKKTVIAATIAFLAISLFLMRFINFELMPSSDDGIINIGIGTKPGLKIENADAIYRGLEDMVAAHPDVEHYSLTSGGSGMLGGGSSRLTAYLHKGREMQTAEVIEQWRRETSNYLDCDIDISLGSVQGMGAGGAGDSVEVMLLGDNFERTKEAAAMVAGIMNAHPDIIRVSSGLDNPNPQAEIVIDPLMAASKGITPQLVTASVYAALNGSGTSTVHVDDRKYSLKVEYPRGRYESVSDIINMMVVSASGTAIPLADIASIEFTDTPHIIIREEGQYAVTVTGTPLHEARFTAQADIALAVSNLTLPNGVTIGQSMRQEMMSDEFASLGMAIITAVLLVFMVMAIQFESIRHSLMVMICLPFAVIGSFALMFLTETTLSMVSLLGFLILVGTVVNNGILFVDTANQYRQTMDLHAALIYAGRTRMRPILLTTLTTILSMMPLALAIGEGTEMMQGLGVTVIGGLSASTLLGLLLLPTFYLIIDGNAEKREARRRKRAEKQELRVLEQLKG
ncbi:MAG: efflux RND transporter permease subunit [Peptococcaceae bacterium]|nr:efflux RND transporter permease subunit [Peptococcaceae bacterium]